MNYHRIAEERLLVKCSTKLEKNEQKMRKKKKKLIFSLKEGKKRSLTKTMKE